LRAVLAGARRRRQTAIPPPGERALPGQLEPLLAAPENSLADGYDAGSLAHRLQRGFRPASRLEADRRASRRHDPRISRPPQLARGQGRVQAGAGKLLQTDLLRYGGADPRGIHKARLRHRRGRADSIRLGLPAWPRRARRPVLSDDFAGYGRAGYLARRQRENLLSQREAIVRIRGRMILQFEQPPRRAFEDRVFLLRWAVERLDLLDAHPVAQRVGIIRSDDQALAADFPSQII